jgi:hypothetical protein
MKIPARLALPIAVAALLTGCAHTVEPKVEPKIEPKVEMKMAVGVQWELSEVVGVQWELPDVLARSVQRFGLASQVGAHTSTHSSALR